MPQELMSTKQVADKLNRTPNLVHWLVKKERLTPAVKLPGKTGAMLFDPVAVEELSREIANRRSPEGPEPKAVA